jgi:hypothetical protein
MYAEQVWFCSFLFARYGSGIWRRRREVAGPKPISFEKRRTGACRPPPHGLGCCFLALAIATLCSGIRGHQAEHGGVRSRAAVPAQSFRRERGGLDSAGRFALLGLLEDSFNSRKELLRLKH